MLANSPSLTPSPVKSKRSTRDAASPPALGDAARGQHVLAAGEAVREQRVGERFAIRQIERRGQSVAIRSRELKAFDWHVGSP